jgi:hypothetical protein
LVDDVTFESGTTVQFGLHPQNLETRLDFDGPVLIGQPQSYLYSLTGMDGKVTIDLSTSFPDSLMGGRYYNLMDFTDAGYRSFFSINTIYPKLENFDLVQPVGAGGRLIMNGHVLSYVIGQSGDFNRDGSVDAADYVFWRQYLGTWFTQQDYSVWRTNFGQSAATSALGSTSVPEPAAGAILLVLGTIVVSLREFRIQRK